MITGKILKRNGWPEGRIIGLAKNTAVQLAGKGAEQDAILAQLDRVRAQPGDFLSDATLGDLARELLRASTPKTIDVSEELRDAPLEYRIWGREHIDDGALAQMDAAMRLPISVAGALMPDAHVGYGLPIGGVLATENVVIPYAVGVDIACRMRLSIFPVSPILLGQKLGQFKKALNEQTRFGRGENWNAHERPEHEVLVDADWKATRLLRSLHDAAPGQLGTSGTGNHFVEWGSFELAEKDDRLGLEPSLYLALLSHSGSRGIGFKIANLYSELAQQQHPDLDPKVRHLAWLDLNSEVGQEYWVSMELAGRFAAANHAVIHRRVAEAVGLKAAAVVENHHNFAWRERLSDGREVIVHRKGATPAGTNTLGIIPGSMGDAGYVVRGRGQAESINSASHGAGRLMSRRKAEESITRASRDAYLRERGVMLLGGAVDESPQAYKPIEAIMAAQDDLVEVLGRFLPKIVRMAAEAGDV
jgi:tRNA-splicing ligase RtcB (3'-phosphate/5'-hydroxy nucleic acid ligase)